MTVQEAIDWLKAVSVTLKEHIHTSSFLKRKEAIHLAIQCMRKQIPMKIKEIHVDEYYCPACGSELNCNDARVEDKYCSECGQRFEVSEEDD